MSALIDKLKSGQPLSKEDESRKTVSEAIKQVRKIVENVKDLRQLEGRLSVPLQTVIRAPSQLGTTGLELTLIIAVCQVLEVLVRLRRRK